jgi:demethylmenaquinone methyltransferase/2-methoxy-6-polyprenyl-1,4-benzoquinol methylase
MAQKQYVAALFNGIARRYDLLNRLLSGGVDLLWRRRAIETLRPLRPRRILDVATGTADLAIASLRLEPESVVGVDIAEEMLTVGRQKLLRKGLAQRITLQAGDAERLPFEEGSFDAVTVAFGVRNFEDLDRGLAGMHRVLRPGGQAVVLEFSRPAAFPFRQVYLFYFRQVLPKIGRLVSSHHEAYTYLPDTVMCFPEGEEFMNRLRRAGFSGVIQKRLTGGIATIYRGTK